jgi:hypothetical protein
MCKIDVAEADVPVELVEVASLPVGEDPRPEDLAFPDHDRVGVLPGLVRQQRAVEAPQDDRRPAGAVVIRDRVHDVRLGGERADGDEIERRERLRVALGPLEVGDVVLLRCDARQRQESERWHAGDDLGPLHEAGEGDAEPDQALVVDADAAHGQQSQARGGHRSSRIDPS